MLFRSKFITDTMLDTILQGASKMTQSKGDTMHITADPELIIQCGESDAFNSCLSITHNGCYRWGATAYAMDSTTIMAYITNTDGMMIWRQLFYMNEETQSIIASKHYGGYYPSRSIRALLALTEALGWDCNIMTLRDWENSEYNVDEMRPWHLFNTYYEDSTYNDITRRNSRMDEVHITSSDYTLLREELFDYGVCIDEGSEGEYVTKLMHCSECGCTDEVRYYDDQLGSTWVDGYYCEECADEIRNRMICQITSRDLVEGEDDILKLEGRYDAVYVEYEEIGRASCRERV